MIQENIDITESEVLLRWKEIFPTSADPRDQQAEGIYMNNFRSIVAEENSHLEPLHLKLKAWKITLGKTTLNNAINTSLLSGIMYMADYRQLPSTILAAVLANLIAIEKVKIDKEEETIFVSLPVKKKYKSPDEWFECLPKKLRQHVNPVGFHDLLEKFVLAGLAKRDGEGDDKYLILEKPKIKFKFLLFDL